MNFDKYNRFGECSNCGNEYMKINPIVVCKDENENEVRVCTNCYEVLYKNKYGNIDDSEDVFIH